MQSQVPDSPTVVGRRVSKDDQQRQYTLNRDRMIDADTASPKVEARFRPGVKQSIAIGVADGRSDSTGFGNARASRRNMRYLPIAAVGKCLYLQ